MAAALCDSHVHLFDPRRFPYVTPRRFTPGEATVPDLREHMRATGVQRVVLVQPSVYGDNHGCLLDGLQSLGPQARGVAVVASGTPQEELARLDAAGVRGARINLVVDHLDAPAVALARLREVESRIPAHWHVQLHVSLGVLQALAGHIERSDRCYVLDHMGLPDPAAGPHTQACAALLQLMRGGRLYIKLSAPYLCARSAPPYPDLAPLVGSLLAARSDRVLWGSNWPHTQGTARSPGLAAETIEAFREVDDRAWLATCRAFSGDSAPAVLGGNAQALYGFA